jgi:hypothetical protein
MGGEKIDVAKDFRDLLRAFVDHDVRFLIVGAYALAVLGRPRATGDLDVWVEPTPRNARKAYEALRAFGAPLHDLTVADLASPGVVFQVGLPPLRIDVLTEIRGVTFAPAWRRRVRASFDDVPIAVLGRQDFLANKRATGRLKDLADAERLERSPRRTRSRPRRR